ncbi:hypothetical protein BDW74DRAFT_176810 [Aspergillus multicolor]|uniref:putative serine carboxypeptidase n=1 Tax=Aspergillus multicolor TaxID=41759 RepID=UPI003CCD3C32
MASVTIVKFLESQQSVLQLPDDIFAAFKEASKTCGFDDILAQAAQFPPEGTIHMPGDIEGLNFKHRGWLSDIFSGICSTAPTTAEEPRSTIDHFSLVTQYFSRADVQMALNVLPSGSTSTPQPATSPTNSGAPAPSPYRHCIETVLIALGSGQPPLPPVYSILPDLVTSYISLHLYSGEYDMLINHHGAKLTLQNMTWNGAQASPLQ